MSTMSHYKTNTPSNSTPYYIGSTNTFPYNKGSTYGFKLKSTRMGDTKENQKESQSYLPKIESRYKDSAQKMSSKEESKVREKETEEDFQDDIEKEINEKLEDLQNIWNYIGVTPSYSENFLKFTEELKDDDKVDFYKREINEAKKLRENLMTFAKEYNRRMDAINHLKDLADILRSIFTKGNKKLSDDLYKEIEGTIKRIRIHSVNSINAFLKLREKINYGITNGKLNKGELKKKYYYEEDFLQSLDNDLIFMKVSKLDTYYEFVEDTEPDTFLLNISQEKTTPNKFLKVIQIEEDLLKAIGQCKFEVAKDSIMGDTQVQTMGKNKSRGYLKTYNRNTTTSSEFNNTKKGGNVNDKRKMKIAIINLRGSEKYNSLFYKSSYAKTKHIKIEAEDEGKVLEGGPDKTVKYPIQRGEQTENKNRPKYGKNKLQEFEKGEGDEENEKPLTQEDIKRMIEEKNEKKSKKSKKKKKAENEGIKNISIQCNSIDIPEEEDMEDKDMEVSAIKKDEVESMDDEDDEDIMKDERIKDEEMNAKEIKDEEIKP
ncbi:MAG: hypothetical protein MJ252_29700, partial [archaeon]|nr:hypothetical protein [archaeon]